MNPAPTMRDWVNIKDRYCSGFRYKCETTSVRGTRGSDFQFPL
jgi:hypothetical protein